MKTIVVNEKNIKRDWYLIDASNKFVGRLASVVATVLIGKGKVEYSPNQDHGDFVIVINADKITLSGKKSLTKTYFRHSTKPGEAKLRSFKEQMKLDSRKVIEHAVKGMISKNPRGRAIIKKLHIYTGEQHPHIAQKPKALDISGE
jgi:large subunit ribosomal protein L13